MPLYSVAKINEKLIHRAGESLGKWIYRVIQWEAEGRTTQPGGILHSRRGEDID